MTNDPIFVVGAPRSGTTLFRLILDSHPRIACGPETHFLQDMAQILGPRWRLLQRYGFDQDWWCQKIASFFDSFKLEHLAIKGKERWADKTPSYTLNLPFIERLFPSAQYVHIIRDGRDVVASHKDRWGYRRAVSATKSWPQYVRPARTFGAGIGPGRYLEVRYEDLVESPEETVRGALNFLREDWSEGMIDYQKSPHDLGEEHSSQLQKRLGGDHREDSPSVFSSRVGVYKSELGPLLRSLVYIRGGRLLRELGYA